VGVGAKEAFAPRQRVQRSKRMVNAVNRLRANAAVDNLSEEAPLEVASAPTGGRKRKARNTAIVEDDDNQDDADFVDNAPTGQAEGVQGDGRKKKKTGGRNANASA
jgi:DNA excision repair protein ERCC-5